VMVQMDSSPVEQVAVRITEPSLRQRDHAFIELDAIKALDLVRGDRGERLARAERHPERLNGVLREERGELPEHAVTSARAGNPSGVDPQAPPSRAIFGDHRVALDPLAKLEDPRVRLELAQVDVARD